MIMQRQSDGTYEQIGFIKSKNGENIDTILDAKGDVYFTQGFTREISGIPPLTLDAIGKNTLDYRIYGNTVQNGTPSPDNPVEVQSVGDLVTEGEFSGKYKIPVVVSGKNLFDYTNIIDEYRIVWATGVLYKDSNAQISEYIPVNSHKEYVTSSKVNIAGYDLNKNYLGVYNGHEFVKIMVTSLYNRFITTDDCRFIRIFKYGTVKNFENDFQLELGTESTPYEPYHEPVTTNIYLNEPLRKIGDYADVLDYNQNTIKRKIGKLIFTGDEAIRSTHLDRNLFMLDMKGYLRKEEITSLNSHYQTQKNVTDYKLVADMRCTFYANSANLSSSVAYIRDSRFSTIDNFKAYLKEQYDAGTPVTVYYALAESRTETLTLPQLPTLNGTTIITTDTEIKPSDIKITYKARKSK